MRWFRQFHREEDAATAVEYAVMLALILMIVVATITQVGNALGAKYTFINAEIQAHSN
jgi:Flp pilus assembly pilin Flp